MQFELNEENVRSMMQRLRSSVGHNVLGVSKAYEAVAHTLGYPNWDTLAGILKKPSVIPEAPKAYSVPKVVLASPVTLYLGANQTGEWEQGPDWAKVVVTQKLLDSLLTTRQQVIEERQTRITGSLAEAQNPGANQFGFSDITWDSSDNFRLEIGCEEVYVEKDRWWISINHRHSDSSTETYAMNFGEFLEALTCEQEFKSDSMLKKNDILLHTSGFVGRDVVANFVDALLEAGELDDSFML